MSFEQTTFVGPPIDDVELLRDVPFHLAQLLAATNGFVALGGGIHLRGACLTPAWHSLREAWYGPHSVPSRYPEVAPADIPFAQDCVGDQFLLRGDTILHLASETGELTPIADSLDAFLDAIRAHPVETLRLEPLLAFQQRGGVLSPGQLLSVYPPFCIRHDGDYSYKAIDAADCLASLSALATQIRGLPDGTPIQLEVLPRAV